jgi:hypothetical protein
MILQTGSLLEAAKNHGFLQTNKMMMATVLIELLWNILFL